MNEEIIKQAAYDYVDESSRTKFNSFEVTCCTNGFKHGAEWMQEQCKAPKTADKTAITKELKEAIESAKSIDYVWDGENETAVNSFEYDEALQNVLQVLIKYNLINP